MAHYLFSVSDGDQEQAAVLLRAKMWGIGRDEKHRGALAPADLVLIYLAPPKQAFIGLPSLRRRYTTGHLGKQASTRVTRLAACCCRTSRDGTRRWR